MIKNAYEKESKLIPYYNNHTEYYSPVSSKEYFFDVLDRFKIENLKSKVVLDLGCGDGRLCEWLPNIFYYGVDYSTDRIELARDKFITKPLARFDVDCVYEYVKKWDELYTPDLITMFEVLEHLEKPDLLIQLVKEKFPRADIVGTVPINLPFTTHLSVWKTEEDMVKVLNPSEVQTDKEKVHWICKW